MNHEIKVAIIGGTGKSGKYLVKAALSQGLSCKLLLRNPDNFELTSPLVEIIKGDARNYDAVKRLVEGCYAVISTIGQPRGESSIFSQATQNVIQAMSEFNVKRYIVTTGLNVDTPADKKSAKVRGATDWMKTNYPQTTLDKQVEFDVLSKSDIDWTLVRLPLIEQTDERGQVLVSVEDCPGDKISSADLAAFLIEQLSHDAYIRKAPFIATV